MFRIFEFSNGNIKYSIYTITNIFKIKLLSYKGTKFLRLYSFVAPPRMYLMMSLFRLGGDLPHLLLVGGLYPCSFREQVKDPISKMIEVSTYTYI